MQRDFGIGAVQIATRLSPSLSGDYPWTTKVAGRRVHLGRMGPSRGVLQSPRRGRPACQCVSANVGGLPRRCNHFSASFLSRHALSRCDVLCTSGAPSHTTHLVHAPLRARHSLSKISERPLEAGTGWPLASLHAPEGKNCNYSVIVLSRMQKTEENPALRFPGIRAPQLP